VIGHGARPLVTEKNLEAERAIKRSRGEERQANWELQKRVAEEALEARTQRNHGTLFERVERAKERLTPLPAGACLALYEAANTIDRDILFLAEEAGKNRKEVLRMWTQPRKSTREQLVQEAGALLQDPSEVRGNEVATPVSPADDRPAKKRASARKKG
jgi:hypothetical protein